MPNTPHDFLITLKMDDKIIATRNISVTEYNDNIIYSLRLNQLMKDMSALLEDALKENDIKRIDDMFIRGRF
jgi:hypothetical protein